MIPDRSKATKPGARQGATGLLDGLQLYIARQASSVPRYCLEQLLFLLVGWLQTIVGIAVRALCYRLILQMAGVAAIEHNVRLRFADQIRLGRNAYLDDMSIPVRRALRLAKTPLSCMVRSYMCIIFVIYRTLFWHRA